MINTISQIIEDAVALIPDSVYLRATDVDANTTIAKIPLAGKTFVLFENLPTISHGVTMGVTASVPVEIRFLKLAELSDTTVQSDDIRNDLIPIAQSLFMKVINDPRSSLVEYPNDYDIELEGSVKLYGSIMTGVTLSFDMFINVTVVC